MLRETPSAFRAAPVRPEPTPAAAPPSPTSTAEYDGFSPFPDVDAPARPRADRILQLVVTWLLVAMPIVGLATAATVLWGHGIDLTDALLGLFFYVATGLAVTVGFHRCFTHRAFKATPALRTVMALVGSMSFEGDVISWVATHRRHHAFSDRPGDPHSPYRYGTGPVGQLRGLLFAHLGWIFANDPTSWERYAPDLLAERSMTRLSRAFPLLCVASLALPFLSGLAIGGTWYAAFTALIWAGLVRVGLLQHVTWSVNSLCHVLGNRPFTTRRHDRATNLWPLALISFGESWHNMHHSDPTCARHGVDRFQFDPSARTIWLFERLGWATDVRWPDQARLASRRNATA
ncbi:MAG TPA: fatty acid desaturase [Actinocrinis sp.]|jgi:stearoyl-CoA desaturase (delta-9 desaturase)|uniref:acyl-CoA desaturase n=1 Tax=Actinocrinis sp. TaxID=1920516 RepID=UPI002DDDA44E|nr:fatty acid desaturase [Actinocrinis sp.]HEV3173835.1 fatty acid desaturase [Actinocrinis sp.]